MVVGEFRVSGGLGHDPHRGRAAVEPAGVVDEVRQHVRHPAGRSAIDGVYSAERAAGDDLLHLAVVEAVTMLVAYHRLHARLADEVAHRKKLRARERNRFLEGYQPGATFKAKLDHVEPHGRRRAEAKDIWPG